MKEVVVNTNITQPIVIKKQAPWLDKAILV
jgi:hypothetical protein